MCILTNLFEFAVPQEELVNIYTLYIWSVVGQSCIVWHSSLTSGEMFDLGRIQTVALRKILKDRYTSYEDALKQSNLKTLSSRRSDLCLKFAKKCVKNEKTRDIFPINDKVRNTRFTEKFFVTKAKTDALLNLLCHSCRGY